MQGHAGVAAEGRDVAVDQLFDRPGRYRLAPEATLAIVACRSLWAEVVSGGIVVDTGAGKQGSPPLDCFEVQWRSAPCCSYP